MGVFFYVDISEREGKKDMLFFGTDLGLWRNVRIRLEIIGCWGGFHFNPFVCSQQTFFHYLLPYHCTTTNYFLLLQQLMLSLTYYYILSLGFFFQNLGQPKYVFYFFFFQNFVYVKALSLQKRLLASGVFFSVNSTKYDKQREWWSFFLSK